MRDDDRMRQQRVTFYRDYLEHIDKLLELFLKRSNAKCAILLDKEGHPILTQGDTQSYDMDTVCTLLAGTFAATREWARLLGEEEFSILFHQGKKDSIQVTLVEERALLAVIFDQQQTQLGLVRLMSNEVTKKLAEVFKKADQQEQRKPGEEVEIGKEFEKTAQDLLNTLFGEES